VWHGFGDAEIEDRGAYLSGVVGHLLDSKVRDSEVYFESVYID
jgi:hypothetical protein